MNRATCGYRGAQNAHCGAAPVGTVSVSGVPVDHCGAHEPKLPALTRRPKGQCWVDGCRSTTKFALCHVHRQMFGRHGVLCSALEEAMPEESSVPESPPPTNVEFIGSGLLAQEAPMTEPTLTPPAAPQDAADGGATPSLAAEPLHPLEARRASLIARLYMAGFVKVDGPAEHLWRFNGPNGAVLIPVGHPCEVERDFADMLDHAEKECAKVEAAATPADAVEPSVGDVADAPLFVGGTTTDPMQQRREAVVARLLALGFKEHEGTDTLRMFLGHGWSVPVPLPGHDESVRKADHMLDDAERLCSRMEKPEPTAPGPTLAEVQAELKEATRLSECRRKEVERRGEALARGEKLLKKAEDERDALRGGVRELWEAATGLDYDASDVEEANLLPQLRAQIAEALADRDRARRERDEAERDAVAEQAAREEAAEEAAKLRADLALTAQALKQEKQRNRDLYEENFAAYRVLMYLGAQGGQSLRAALMQVLSPEDRRAVLEVEVARARVDLACVKARRVDPATPQEVAEYEARAAAAQAALGGLPEELEED